MPGRGVAAFGSVGDVGTVGGAWSAWLARRPIGRDLADARAGSTGLAVWPSELQGGLGVLDARQVDDDVVALAGHVGVGHARAR